MIGLIEVTGPGVIVTLSDSKNDVNTALNVSDLLVHDADVLSVINELKNAGAEAISINDQRLVPTSSILLFGLGYMDINYKSWFKYIWMFALIVLAAIMIFAAFAKYVF